MHSSALLLAERFFATYLTNENFPEGGAIADVGSRDVNGSLKSVAPSRFDYVGIDFEPGNGVDVVLQDPYQFPFPDGRFDVVISSSCLEHSEFFWLTFNEICRIVRPGGVIYINAPSNGWFHRFPVDCYRFYPDAGRALQRWAVRSGYSVSLEESFIHSQIPDFDILGWNDSVMVFSRLITTADAEHGAKLKSKMYVNLPGARNVRRGHSDEIINFVPQTEDQWKIGELTKSPTI